MKVTPSPKVYADAASALRGVVKDGMTLMCGGFGVCGIPENLMLRILHLLLPPLSRNQDRGCSILIPCPKLHL